MRYKLICFDLQGTLTNSEYSDYFWFEVLPELYSKVHTNGNLEKAKSDLKSIFLQYGKYDYRYYSVAYWIEELGLNTTEDEVIALIKEESIFYTDMELLVQELSKKTKVIVLSTTVRSFMTKELNGHEDLFQKTYSALDDFSSAGKNKNVYERIAQIYGVEPNEAINIGDNKEMDIENAHEAGWAAFLFDKTISRSKMIAELRIQLKDNLS